MSEIDQSLVSLFNHFSIRYESQLKEEGFACFETVYHSIMPMLEKGESASDMARSIHFSRQRMNFVLNKLKAAKYVKTSSSKKDLRSTIYSLSKKGETRYKRGAEVADEIVKEYKDKIGSVELEFLQGILRKLTQAQ